MAILTANFLWLKAFHVAFVVTWFAGLFYLPRLFVYHAAATDVISVERFKVMERRLFSIMTLGGALAVLFGISMLIANAAYLQQPWMHAKLTLVILLIAYHIWCYRLLKQFARNQNVHSQRWYRLFNEAPALFLLAIVILVVVKPQW